MQIVLYNPLSASSRDRLEQISYEFPRIEAVVLPGSGAWRHNASLLAEDVVLKNHAAIVFGWRRGWAVGRACGITVLLRKAWRESVKSIHHPPEYLQGRVAAIRIKTKCEDLLLAIVYAPSYGSLPLQQHRRVIQGIVAFIEGILAKIGQRTTPILLGDLNEKFGIIRQDGLTLARETEVTGTWQAGVEKQFAEDWRELAAREAAEGPPGGQVQQLEQERQEVGAASLGLRPVVFVPACAADDDGRGGDGGGSNYRGRQAETNMARHMRANLAGRDRQTSLGQHISRLFLEANQDDPHPNRRSVGSSRPARGRSREQEGGSSQSAA